MKSFLCLLSNGVDKKAIEQAQRNTKYQIQWNEMRRYNFSLQNIAIIRS